MSKGRLTRQELGWLLTQEAQGAAERLRTGVSALTVAPRPGLDTSGVDATLSVLDDTMKMLSSLHAHPVSAHGRRGRIDLAALVWEVAPEARVSIEPGSGTEVFGEEAELRRMLHVMLGHGSGSGRAVIIRRRGDEVIFGVTLGPDTSATAETEHAWLARMAMRYGGRFELEGSMEILALPADGTEARDDLAKLHQELDEARKQGEAYARELAAAWASGEEPPPRSTYPPPATPETDRHATIARFAGGVAASLRAMLFPVGRELSELRASLSSRKSSPDLELGPRTDLEERLERIRRNLLTVQDLAAELSAVGESDPNETRREVDLLETVRGELKAFEPRAARAGVELRFRSDVGGDGAPATALVAPHVVATIVRELIAHAVGATQRGSAVMVTVLGPGASSESADAGEAHGARVIVDDGGTIVPASARRVLLALEVEPGTFGRPSSVGLFLAAEMASAQDALLELGDAPLEAGGGGGLRVSVTFAR
ncbi:MAG: hypothetical protein M3O50_08265 [Myxococcota bacterium]|nr:hypothetical protein [Myxococcota bacterium]